MGLANGIHRSIHPLLLRITPHSGKYSMIDPPAVGLIDGMGHIFKNCRGNNGKRRRGSAGEYVLPVLGYECQLSLRTSVHIARAPREEELQMKMK